MTAPEQFMQALAAMRRGQFGKAEALCAEILKSQPAHADALHLLGIFALQRGRAEEGVAWLEKSIDANPRQAAVHCNLGNGLRDAGRPRDALDAYRRALELEPGFAGASYGLGNAFMDLDQPEDALAAFERALALHPSYAEAHNNCGNALMRQERLEEALASFRRALECSPTLALAVRNCATVLARLNRCTEALILWTRLIALQPNDAAAFGGRAQCLVALQRVDEALQDFDASLRLDPDNAETLYGRGTALRLRKRHQAALNDFERARQLRPHSVDIAYRRAEALRDLQRPVEAGQAFAEVLQLAPDRDFALGNLLQARLQVCDWTDHAALIERALQEVAEGRRVYLPGPFFAIADSAALQLACVRAFGGGKNPVVTPPLWTGQRYAHEKIRVAYVSADFREHPVAVLLAGVLERHDRERFEITGIALAPHDGSALGRRVRSAFGECIDVGDRTDAEVAALLRAREIDIAIDLMGHTGSARPGIFAHRPAPVQVSYLGFTGTMASPHLDYVMADRVVIPAEDAGCFSECVVHLPECYQPGDDQRIIAAHLPTRAECGLPASGFVFCCFSTHYKIAPDVFAVWMRLLGEVPGSVLWLAAGLPVCEDNLRREAGARGVDPERLIFAPRKASAEEHLARLACADLFLDTLPFNAHVTASDALWAGLPVLTCKGRGFAARVAASLLVALDLPELVTYTLPGYEARALQLATTPALLGLLRSRLAINRLSHPLYQTERYCRHLEAAYSTMHERVRDGLPPGAFAVEALAFV